MSRTNRDIQLYRNRLLYDWWLNDFSDGWRGRPAPHGWQWWRNSQGTVPSSFRRSQNRLRRARIQQFLRQFKDPPPYQKIARADEWY
jgi:hypothetical protein